MKHRADFQNMFEPADAGFEDAVQRTLRRIRRGEGSVVRKKLRIGLVFAVLLSLLLAAAALAAAFRWGVLDFATGRGSGTNVLPEAAELVQDATVIPQTGGHLKDADFSVRQAVYDGNQAYVVVEVKAKDADAMLTTAWNNPSGRASNLVRSGADSDATIEDYGKKRGKTRFVAVEAGMPVGSNWFEDTGDSVLEEDGTMIVMLQGGCKENLAELAIDLSCFVTPFVKGPDGEWVYDEPSMEKGVLSFTLKRSDSTLDRVEVAQPLEYPGAGVRVDRVTLEVKPMAVYYKVEYTVTDLKAFEATENGVVFEFLDADGKRIEGGASNGGIQHIGDGDGFGEEAPLVEGGQFIETGSLTAMERLPESITLRAFNCWEKNRYEAHEIRLK
jgi:hypothetical protein